MINFSQNQGKKLEFISLIIPSKTSKVLKKLNKISLFEVYCFI